MLVLILSDITISSLNYLFWASLPVWLEFKKQVQNTPTNVIIETTSFLHPPFLFGLGNLGLVKLSIDQWGDKLEYFYVRPAISSRRSAP